MKINAIIRIILWSVIALILSAVLLGVLNGTEEPVFFPWLIFSGIRWFLIVGLMKIMNIQKAAARFLGRRCTRLKWIG